MNYKNMNIMLECYKTIFLGTQFIHLFLYNLFFNSLYAIHEVLNKYKNIFNQFFAPKICIIFSRFSYFRLVI